MADVSDTSAATDRYLPRRLLGHGAMGDVWLADDQLLRRPVAVKRLRSFGGPHDRANLERIVREARLAARLSHPNAVRVFDLVIEDGTAYLVMEYVAGKTLAAVISAASGHGAGGHSDRRDHGALAVPAAAALIGQVADALAAAHSAGIVHRDVKPSNILITDSGLAKLADFGVARQAGDAALTHAGLTMGTPAYLAPELARGGAPSPAGDVWALGATLFAALEGAPPYGPAEADPLGVLARIVSEPAPPARHAGALRPLIAGMLDQQPAKRPTAAEAAEILRAASSATRADADARTSQSPPSIAAPTPPAPPPSHLPVDATELTTPIELAGATPRRWRWIAVGVVAALVLAVAAFLLAEQGGTTGARRAAGGPATSSGATTAAPAGVLPTANAKATSPAPSSLAPRSPSSTSEPTTSRPSTAGNLPTGNLMTRATMSRFVRRYYAMIPGNLPAAFGELGPSLHAQGFAHYRDWWARFSSVSVTPVAADPAAHTVTIHLSAVRPGGAATSDTELLTLVTSPDHTRLLINTSRVINN